MPIKKKHVLHPLFLLTGLCLCIGIYKIATLACVSTDSVTFMQFVQELKTSPGHAIESYDQHPGYPVMILASEWIIKTLGMETTLQQRIIAAQSVTLLTRTIAVCYIYAIFCLFMRRDTAFWSTILLILIPAYADIGSDVLSDWPCMMWMAIAFYFSLLGLRHKHLSCFIAAGTASDGVGNTAGSALVVVLVVSVTAAPSAA